MHISHPHQPILVIGGTGKTGRRVADRLQALGRPVRIGSRSGAPPFDWEAPATWAPALRGASAAYVSFYPDVAIPEAVDAIGGLARTAVHEGVERLVLLSGRGEVEAQRAEAALAASGAAWTVLRASWFMQNFSEGFWRDPLSGGELALPARDVPVPFVDVEDIADVAVAALTEDGHSGEVYELTGPRALTFAEAVGEIAAASGRDLRFVPISADEYAAGALAEGAPPEVVDILTYLFAEVLVEANAGIGYGTRRALGRAARDFAPFAREASAAGAWSPTASGIEGREREAA